MTILHMILLKFFLPSKYCAYGILDWKASILLPALVIQTCKVLRNSL